ncbi:hypothetical protein BaRGS_00031409, partial [Batillaria attramentaria]
ERKDKSPSAKVSRGQLEVLNEKERRYSRETLQSPPAPVFRAGRCNGPVVDACVCLLAHCTREDAPLLQSRAILNASAPPSELLR